MKKKDKTEKLVNMFDQIDEEHIWKIIKNFFEKKGLVYQQIEHFNYYINNGIQEVINDEVGIEIIPKKQKITPKIK